MKFLNEIDSAAQLKQDAENRLVTDAQKLYWNNKVDSSRVLTDVPANAKFTDTNTITTINDKTGAITKADIVALGIPAQDTVYTLPSTLPYSMLTGTPTIPVITGKQDKLTAGANITISGTTISAKDTVCDILDNLTSTSAAFALSANQGRVLDEKTPNKEYYIPKPDTTNNATGNAEGYNTIASGSYSHAEGYNTIASGDCSHAEGYYTEADGNSSHAEGESTEAWGDASHAEGRSTKAGGNYSHAEGFWTKADGNYSHAEGNNTVASGFNSHAEGYLTSAEGLASHAQNEGTIARGQAQTVIGSYNVAQGSNTARVETDFAFIIGNGVAGQYTTDRSNAFTVNWRGDVDIPAGANYKINGVAIPDISGKQDKLIAGTNITILNNVISSTGGGGGSETYNLDGGKANSIYGGMESIDGGGVNGS